MAGRPQARPAPEGAWIVSSARDSSGARALGSSRIAPQYLQNRVPRTLWPWHRVQMMILGGAGLEAAISTTGAPTMRSSALRVSFGAGLTGGVLGVTALSAEEGVEGPLWGALWARAAPQVMQKR